MAAQPFRRLRRWLRPRSAGVRVTRATLRAIDRGDAARDRADWPAAAAGYEAALALAPGLAHIWVQLGHARREAGAAEAARDAYREAARCRPADRETQLVLADLARKAGDRDALLAHTLAAFRLDPADARTRATLLRALSVARPGHEALIEEAAGTLGLAPAVAATPGDDVRLWVDVGDLIDHLLRARLPSGLQRLEIEAARAMLAIDPAVALCCYVPVDAAWKPLPADTFLALVEASQAGGEEDWQRALAGALLGLAAAAPVAFARGATLFNLGMAWGDRDYHGAVAALKRTRGIRFAALACDVIPLLFPDQVPGDIADACARWLDDVADVADRVMAISRATRDDVVRVSAERGRPIAAERVIVVPLDGETAGPASEPLGAETLARWRLRERGFVLYVSTIEPRKNHLGALAAWERLIADLGERGVPDLVCVGRPGWRSAPVEARLAASPALQRRVRLLSGISDAELDLLNRACAFVLYPSLYEGWGLPVTEALCRGKLPAIGDNSSLPEAGGAFAVYYDASRPEAIAAAVAGLIRDPAALAAREAAIRERFRPRSWTAIAREMIEAVAPVGAA